MLDYSQDFKEKNVLIWGLGLNGGGLGAAKFFMKYAAKVTVTDLKTATELKEPLRELEDYAKSISKDVRLVLGEHKAEDFLWADIVIRNPGIPETADWLRFCQDHGKEVQMEAALFLKYCPAYTIGVTGTRGKSTTTALITHILQKTGKKVHTGGNNQIALLTQLENLRKDEFVVIELSSFQLTGLPELQVSPNLSVVTNMYPDHLNWHRDMQDYINAKVNIVRYQNNEDIKILNVKNEIVRKNFTAVGNGELIEFGNDIETELGIPKSKFKISGEHNYQNIAAAMTAARALKINEQDIRAAVTTFPGLRFRQELVAEKKGIKFINDSTSTMPQALNACLINFGKAKQKNKLHLICGGMDKNLPLGNLTQVMSKYADTIHFLAGSFYDKVAINNQLRDVPQFGPFNTMADAVHSAVEQASSADYVILSPAAASFNLFIHEWDRGNQFNQIVNNL